MGIIAAGQITVVDLSDAPVLNTFITASRPTTQTYSKDSGTYKPSYASTPQVLTLKVTKAGSTANIIDSISSLHWFVVDGPIKTEITSKDNSANEYISGTHNEILTTKLDIDLNKGSKRYEVMGIWPDPSTGLDVQFGGYIDLLLTQNGATGPQGPQGDTGNGIANTVITYGLSMSDTTEPATWSSEMPTLVKGMYLWTRTVIIYTNGSSTTSYQISYIAKDADATAEIDKAKQELLEKLETVRDESLEAVDEAKQQLVTVRDESLAAAEEAKQGLANVASELNTAKQDLTDSVSAVNNKVDNAKEELTQAKQDLATVADDLSTAKQDFQNAVSAVDTKATNLQSDLTQAKQDLASQAQQLQEQAGAQSELTNRVSSVEKTANGTKTTVSELSKTVAQNGKDITSVTARTKVVEDDLAGTKTTLSQVQTTANSTSQKTATLETGLNGLSAKFNSLSVGNKNYLPASRVVNRGCSNFNYSNTTKSWTMTAPASSSSFGNGITFNTKELNILLNGGETLFFGLMIKANKACSFNYDVNNALSGTTSNDNDNDNDDRSKRAHSPSNKSIPANVWTRVWFSYTAKANVPITENKSKFGIVNNTEPVTIEIKEVMVAKSNVPVDYQAPDADLEQKIAEYKQNADQNYASLQTTVQNLDGTVQHNKTVADQTAQGFTTRIESLETYKDGESTRANQYFESAKTETAKQLTAERTAIAKDYVAKSTYTSDVTGIRNDLSATTTTANTIKTNLANYQASNDRAVANLQSNIQTANGDISSLKTKVEAVPGQITSAVSAVESKIPTEIGARNYIRDYGLTATGWTSLNSGWKFEIISDSTAKSGQYLKATCTTASTSLSGFYKNLFDFSDGRFFGKQMTWSMDVKTSKNTSIQIGCEWGNALSNVNVTENWQRFSKTFKVATSSNQKAWIFYSSNWNVGDIVYIRDVQLEDGSIATTPVPAIEDTKSDITKLSSEIKQTADGMTLLATKTEVNSAKTELQSGIATATNKANNAQNAANNNAQTISTHTTQISALNTGLQAKVSQSDFNTLSGRVTTAENNITAKANELSSKITSVEGKIPTNLDSLNLMTGTRDWSTKANKWHMGANWSTESKEYQGLKVHSTQKGFNGSHQNIFVKNGDVITFSFFAKATNTLSKIKVSSRWNGSSVYQAPLAGVKESDEQITITSEWKRYSKTVHITSDGSLQFRTEYDGETIPNGNTFYVAGLKLAKSSQDTGYSENPTDVASDITKLSTTLTQTSDGLKQLSTQVTSQGNTITSHTNSINSLTTGLNAKVSQTEFNTLSGRVTTAENNITAKANELSSKITSVEGKIPTTVGARNYIRDYGLTATGWTSLNSGWKFEIISDSTAKSGQYLKATCTTASTSLSGFYKNLFDFSDGRFFGKQMTWSMDVKTSKNTSIQIGCEWGNAQSNVNTTTNWQRFSKTFKVATSSNQKAWIFYGSSSNWNVGDIVYIRDVQLEDGSIATSPVPAIEDTESDITKLSSELTQTKDGITLLATKTELNTAKNELQSGINTATNKANAAQNTANSAQNKANSNAQTISTHTTQISALNTGLQAKVSQTDFNTLSGRVTNAENNITAKANELSSKITSVEGKIPTTVGGRNYALKTGDSKSSSTSGDKLYDLSSGFDGIADNATLIIEFDWRVTAPTSTSKFRINRVIKYSDGTAEQWDDTIVKNGVYTDISSSSGSGHYSGTFTKVPYKGKAVSSRYLFLNQTTASGTVTISNLSVRVGSLKSDWQPAPEDTISDITKLNTTLTQTADGLKQLSTKVTSQGNTITSHTNSINSLTTGLQAKVSQTDFNTLSGRVTTAENNITAKANELSSKITSVEGKIPTSIGARNYIRNYGLTATGWGQTTSGWSFEIIKDSTAKSGQYLKATCTKAGRNGFHKNLFDFSDGRFFGKQMTWSMEIKLSKAKSVKIGPEWGYAYLDTNATTEWKRYSRTFTVAKTTEYNSWIFYTNDNVWNVGDIVYIRDVQLEDGSIATSPVPAIEDTKSDINAVSSELKQTTDSIKASVSSLDKSTVKSSSLTINSDGIVMKAGKSTTDVANAIGSYFAVNQNAIDLFADKIKVKGNMIVNGTITGDKIKANSVDVSKISGLDATYLRAKIETAMVDWLKGKTIVADNGATKIDLMNGYINFNSDTPAIRRVTPGIPTQFIKFLKSDINSVTTIGSNRDGSESSTNDSFAGIKITSSNLTEQTEIISDQIYFLTGASSGNRRGWHMSTISGNDSRQITLVPTGNVTKSSIYASEHFIGGRNGWVNLRDFINYINQCLGHLQNHTGRYDIWKPFEI